LTGGAPAVTMTGGKTLTRPPATAGGKELLMSMRSAPWFAALCTVVLAAPAPAGDRWPQFRGPGAAGVADDPGLPDAWTTTKNVAWQVGIPGRGWSSPVVWGERIFITSVLREGKFEEAKKGLYFGGERMKPPADAHRWMVYCLDWQTGKVRWERQAHQGVPPGAAHIKNTYASETPVTDGERVYAYFGNLGLFCYDLDGKELWSKKWGAFKTRFGWGPAASPVLHQGRLFVVNDNEEKSFLVALDAKTGDELWRVERDEKSNWATPFVWENEKRTELVTPGTTKVSSYGLDGKPLWELGGMSSITIPTPVAAHGLLFVSSGYVLDAVRPVYAVRPGASGDITLGKGETGNDFIAWSNRTAGPYNPSPVVYGEYLYVLYDRGSLSCYEARTGKVVYDKQRFPDAASGFTASPWAYGGKVFCLSEDGDTYVVQAGPEVKVLGKNSLDEMCMATPAAARGSLVVRTLTKLYRIRNSPEGGAPQGNTAVGELEKLQGTWVVTSGEREGKPLPEAMAKSAKLVITGKRVQVFLKGKEDHEQTLEIDPGQNPKHMNLTRELDGRKTTLLGIYSLEGKTLKLCGDDRGKERPTEFSTQGKPGYSLLVLERP
jgi:uncharacterized protein (TIGR03067 family)